MLAQLERGALGGGAAGGAGVTAAHLDLVEGAVVLALAVVGTAGDRALDAGIVILIHGIVLLTSHLGVRALVWHGAGRNIHKSQLSFTL